MGDIAMAMAPGAGEAFCEYECLYSDMMKGMDAS